MKTNLINKVGILTFSHTSNMNYGAMLQSFATYSTLEKNGYKPYIIDWKLKRKSKLTFKDIHSENKIFFLYLCLRRFIGVECAFIIQWFSLFYGEKVFKEFSKQYLPRKTVKCTTLELNKLNKLLDAFIVGSDQVWRYKTCPHIEHFFLDFVDDTHRKISYAASFGINKWNEAPLNKTITIQKLIERFDFVSVRESSGVNICNDDFNIEATLVLDPTLLLNEEDYRMIYESEPCEDLLKDKYNAVMFLDSNNNSTFYAQLSKISGIKTFSIKGHELSLFSKVFIRYSSIPRWINYIRNAEFVLTDSYHCAIFSILFKKKFAVIAHHSRGIGRMHSLLSLFKFQERLFEDKEQFLNSRIWESSIDYDCVAVIIENEKNKSLNFLFNSLD